MFDSADQYGLLYEGGGGIDQVREYLLGVFAAAIICAIVTKLTEDKGANSTLSKLIAGLFLVFTLIRPVATLDLTTVTTWADNYDSEAARAVAAGESHTRNAISELIKQRTQAYILDKAQALNTELEVEVTLSDDDIPVPVKVRLKGKASPYAKGRLQAIITEDLGIEKENQVWT